MIYPRPTLVALLLAAILLALLSGCGGSDDADDDRKDTQPVTCGTPTSAQPVCTK